MEDNAGNTQLAQKIPKQVPKDVDPVVVKDRAEMSASAIKAMMILQIILSIFLNGALDDLWGLFFTLQIMCYMKVYDIFFPTSAEGYVNEFTKIIEFEILEPEAAIKVIFPDFDLRAYLTG